MLDALEPAVAAAFERALAALRDAGAQVVEIGLPELGEVAAINATGGFSAAESWAWHRARLAIEEARYDPRVAARIRRGATMSAADYIDLLAARRDWIARMERAIAGFDALLSPTVPCVAPRARAADRPTTPRSSPPTPCCCATPRSSTCSTAARSRCRASARANVPSG